jgi:L,D-peptidoglycan transpeptidase YkuD (ErfK/YbiS/YcfS/YnhG family)
MEPNSTTLKVSADGILTLGENTYRCALGPGGIVPAAVKREGDGATPEGTWSMRRIFYRPDRLTRPDTSLSPTPLEPTFLWCDEPESPAYNTLVEAPFEASHEVLWRDDGVYDIVVELGFNDDPVVPGKGSAIFFHLAREDYSPTEGCVAVALEDMLEILKVCDDQTVMRIG